MLEYWEKDDGWVSIVIAHHCAGVKRFNSPAAVSKFYELLTGEDLSWATMSAEKRISKNRAPRVV